MSDGVVAQLGGCGITTTRRLAGATRFDTAAAMAQAVGGTNAYLVQGVGPNPQTGFADAISVSGLAAYQGRPILLTNTDSLPPATAQALSSLGITSVTIVGGNDAVSPTVEQQVANMGITVDRVAGADRFATSAQVADLAAQAGMSPAQPWLATGLNWPDALSAGPAVAKTGGDLLLVNGPDLAGSPASQAWIDDHGPSFTQVTLLGGPDVLAPSVAVAALVAAGG